MDTTHSILKSAKAFFAGTALSRISGLLRDIVMAASFGSSPEIAAFMVAYRLANLFRRLLGEGNLQAGFVPHLITQKENGPLFFRDVTYSLGIILLIAVLSLEGILWGCLQFVPADWTEIVTLSMWMVPGLFFICLYGLNSALLQCQKKYFLPAVAPVIFNVIWIAVIFFFPDVKILAMSITAAFAGQWLITAIEGGKFVAFKDWFKPRFFSSEFRALLKPLLLGIIGISAVQLNSALDAIFARIADPEGPAFLWYAIRIQQLPLSLFGIALSGALLPPLSRAEDPIKRQALLDGALRQASTLMLVCTFGIFALAASGVNLLYGHGSFTLADVWETSRCLWAYGLGLVPSVFVLLLGASFYAQKNYRIPTLASLISVGANVALNALFVFWFGWGAVSIALATSLSAFLNVAFLSKRAFSLDFGKFFIKTTFACALPAMVTLLLQTTWTPALDPWTQLLQFGLWGGMYLLGIIAMLWKLKLHELKNLLSRKVT